MLQERDVFREIMRLVGLALLVYGLYTALQYGLTVLYFSPYDSISANRLLLVPPLAYALLGSLFLLSPASIAAFAYPSGQTGEWSHRHILTIGIKLSGLWLVFVHLGSFLKHLQHHLVQMPLVGRYQVLTHSIWPAVAIYIAIIIIGMIMFRYQPRVTGEGE